MKKPPELKVVKFPTPCVTCGRGGTFQVGHKIYCRLCWYDVRKGTK